MNSIGISSQTTFRKKNDDDEHLISDPLSSQRKKAHKFLKVTDSLPQHHVENNRDARG